MSELMVKNRAENQMECAVAVFFSRSFDCPLLTIGSSFPKDVDVCLCWVRWRL